MQILNQGYPLIMKALYTDEDMPLEQQEKEKAKQQLMDMLRAKLNRYNAQHQKIFREFVSEVEMVSLDGNGRFLIPKRYLQMAGIVQNIKFIGMGDTIEIWSNEKIEESRMNSEEFGQALESIMTQEVTPGTY